MNIRKAINDYVECNRFEIKILNEKVMIYYYDKIDYFSQKRITILKDNKKINVEGNKLIIETMFEELIIISGDVDKIIFGTSNE